MRIRSWIALAALVALAGCGKERRLVVPPEPMLAIIDMTIGSGVAAIAGDTLVVEYVGRFTDSTAFDATRGRPFTFVLGKHQVIRGFDEGLLGMRVGGSRRLVIPPAYGYGENGAGPIPPNATIVYDVTLDGLVRPPHITTFP